VRVCVDVDGSENEFLKLEANVYVAGPFLTAKLCKYGESKATSFVRDAVIHAKPGSWSSKLRPSRQNRQVLGPYH
jgi:hypothetical protein